MARFAAATDLEPQMSPSGTKVTFGSSKLSSTLLEVEPIAEKFGVDTKTAQSDSNEKIFLRISV